MSKLHLCPRITGYNWRSVFATSLRKLKTWGWNFFLAILAPCFFSELSWTRKQWRHDPQYCVHHLRSLFFSTVFNDSKLHALHTLMILINFMFSIYSVNPLSSISGSASRIPRNARFACMTSGLHQRMTDNPSLKRADWSQNSQHLLQVMSLPMPTCMWVSKNVLTAITWVMSISLMYAAAWGHGDVPDELVSRITPDFT